MQPTILCHGGVGAPVEAADGAQAAARRGAEVLGRSAVDAVVEATMVLEDDPRFNAGTGANLRLDGRTVEMDAGLMDSRGRTGAVAAVRDVRHPILLARAVLDSPHLLIAGEGATRLARRLGLPRARRGVPERTREKYRRAVEGLQRGEAQPFASAWRGDGWLRLWNFPGEPPVTPPPASRAAACDTVGAVAMDSRGRFAAANSTGGTTLMLMGRVGDSPLVGCGFYAGPAGAVTATGVGEEIIRRLLAYRVYQWMEEGYPAQEACERGRELFPRSIPVGILALDHRGAGVAASRPMPWAGLVRRRNGRLAPVEVPS